MTEQEMKAMLMPPDIFKGKKALCVQPHPDDNEFGMASTIVELVKNGCQVDYLTITDGGLGAPSLEMSGETLIKKRREESQNAGKVLGVSDFYFLDFPDGSLNDVQPLAGLIAERIREGQYDMVFCPDPWLNYEAHWDHIVAGKATANAFLVSTLLEYPRGTKTKACFPFAIGFYLSAKPNTIIDISDSLHLQFESLAKHESQFTEALFSMYQTYFTFRAQKFGKEKGCKFGEGLRIMSPLHLHCFPESESI